MDIKLTEILCAGIERQQLAHALGLTPASITYWSKKDDALPKQYQFDLMHGSKEAKAIRRKVLKWRKSQ